MSDSDRRLWLALSALPIIPLLPMLRAPLPAIWHPAREVAGYFQALAFVRAGPESYLFLTPEENLSALHLHSLLSAPFVALGFPEGGRLVSMLAAGLAAFVAALIAARLADRRAAFLVIPLLWIHPLFARLATRFMTDTLSMALTAGAVLTILHYHDTDEDRWFYATLGLLVLGITNHMWEATIGLPLVAVLLYRREVRRAATLSGVATLTAGIVWWITTLQPKGAGTLTKYGTHERGPGFLIDPGWWFWHWQWPPHPMNLEAVFLLPTAIVLAIGCGWWFRKSEAITPLVLGTWLVSGMAIPFSLAGGFGHKYHQWALVVPVSVTIAILVARGLTRISLPSDSVGTDRAVQVLTATLLVTALVYGAVVEAGALSNSGVPGVDEFTDPTSAPLKDDVDAGEAYEAGLELRELGVSNVSQVVFVGPEWNESRRYYRRLSMTRVLIYSGLLPRERYPPNHVNRTNPDGPTFWLTTPELEDCEALVYADGTLITVEKC